MVIGEALDQEWQRIATLSHPVLFQDIEMSRSPGELDDDVPF